MKLRSQTLWAVVPLFVVLGAAGAGVSWWLKFEDLRRGLELKGEAVAVSLAEYAAGDAMPRGGSEAEQTFLAGVQRLARWEALVRLRIWNAEGAVVSQWPVADAADSIDLPRERWTDPASVRDRPRQVLSRLDFPAGGDPLIHATAAILNGQGQIIGWVETELEAEEWMPQALAIRRSVLLLFGTTVAVGLLLSLLISQVMAQDLRRLISVASDVGGGRYVSPEGLRLREIDDLGETFGVLDGLTHEYRQKFQRAMTENEIFRTSADLAQVYREQVMPGFDRVLVGRRVISKLNDQGTHVRWHGTMEVDGRAWYWQGAVKTGLGLEAAQRATAAADELRSLLGPHGLSLTAALSELTTLYALATAQVVSWTATGDTLEICSWNPETGLVEQQTRSHERPCLIHDLDEEMTATIEALSTGTTTGEGAKDLHDTMLRLLADTPAAIALIVEAG